MKSKIKTSYVLYLVPIVLCIVACIMFTMTQTGKRNHKTNVENLEIELRNRISEHEKADEDLNAVRESVELEKTKREAEAEALAENKTEQRMITYMGYIKEAGDIIADAQNRYQTLSPWEELPSDIEENYRFNIDISDLEWYPSFFDGCKWVFKEPVAAEYSDGDLYDSDLANVKLIWFLESEDELKAVTFGDYDRHRGVVFYNTTYCLSIDQFTKDNNPTAPNPEGEGYWGEEGEDWEY